MLPNKALQQTSAEPGLKGRRRLCVPTARQSAPLPCGVDSIIHFEIGARS